MQQKSATERTSLLMRSKPEWLHQLQPMHMFLLAGFFAFSVLCFVSRTYTPIAGAPQGMNAAVLPATMRAYVFQSIRDSDDRLQRKDDVLFTLPSSENDRPGTPSASLDVNRRFQSIVGFGGAFTDAAALTLSKLKPSLQAEILDAYFSNKGNRYTNGRVHINSCDFSVASYSFDDKADDFQLEHFDMHLKPQDEVLIPMIKSAMERIEARGAKLKLFVSPWSPPAWMKTNNNMLSSDRPCLKPDSQVHQAWALYFEKYITALERKGVPVWGLTVQNEPEYAAPWEACEWTAEEERDFVRDYLGPTLNASHPDVKIMIHDHNKDHIFNFAKIIYSDPQAAQYVWGTAFHWYSGDAFENVAATAAAYPEKHLLASEACNCPGVELNAIGTWWRGEAYGHDIIGDLLSGTEAWTDWNLVLNQEGGPNHLGNNCDSPVVAYTQEDPQRYLLQPTYYFMGHFSRFLPPGAVRIQYSLDADSEATQIEAVAFYVEPSASGKSNNNNTSDSDSDNSGVHAWESQPHIVFIALNRQDSWDAVRVRFSASTSPVFKSAGGAVAQSKFIAQVATFDFPPHSITTVVVPL